MILCLTATCAPLLEPDCLARAVSLLPAWRQEQVLSRSTPEHRATGAGAWLLLEQGAKQLHISLPRTPPAYTKHGKPYFPELPFFTFSLSHSKNRCLCLLGDTGEKLGCDLEQLRPRLPWQKLAQRFFHPQEVTWLLGQQQPEASFFRLWCEKEAVLKATGAGFSQGMQQFSLRGGSGKEFPFFRIGWILGEYAYCLCGETPPQKTPRQWAQEISLKDLVKERKILE